MLDHYWFLPQLFVSVAFFVLARRTKLAGAYVMLCGSLIPTLWGLYSYFPVLTEPNTSAGHGVGPLELLFIASPALNSILIGIGAFMISSKLRRA